MIKKIISLKNLCVLKDPLPNGAIDLARCTIIYGGNGSGKTAISHLLRSLATDVCTCLLPRATLGQSEQPSAELLISGSHHRLKDQTWKPPRPGVVVFDNAFVNANIYTGTQVAPDHRKNLCHFILGAEGVTLAQKVDSLDSEIKGLTTQISDAINALEGITGHNMSVDEFLRLVADPDIDTNINNAEKELAVAQDADAVHDRAEFEEIELPRTLAEQDVAVLSRTIEEMAVEAVETVRTHISEHLKPDGESWLKTGVGYMKCDVCPFCGQNTQEVQLVEALKGYFGEVYVAFVEEIESTAIEMSDTYSSAKEREIEQVILSNNGAVEFWRRYMDVPSLTCPRESIEELFSAVRSKVLPAFKQKANNPISDVSADDLAGLIKITRNADCAVAQYNGIIRKANCCVAQCKENASSGDVDAYAKKLAQLRVKKQRWAADTVARCEDLSKLKEKKQRQNKEKTETRAQLNTHMEELAPHYQNTLNIFLNKFNVLFNVEGVKAGFAGGKPRADYKISLCGRKVDVSAKPSDDPHFDSMLSDGDKQTLALALFLAQLEGDKELARKIIVLDDPLSSLDRHRKKTTIAAMVDLAQKCQQLIVMTHNLGFAVEAEAALKKAGLGKAGGLITVAITREDNWSTLKRCELSLLNRTAYEENCDVLEAFGSSSDGSSLEAVKAIRPVIEGVLRFKYRNEFCGVNMLGKMIDRIKESDASSSLCRLHDSDILNELSEINSYTTPFMHGEGAASQHTPDPREADGYVQRTRKLIPLL